MDYKNAFHLFQTLLEEGDENLSQRLLSFITSGHELFDETTKLIAAYQANKKETLVNDLINGQAETLVDDSQIHELLNTQIAQYKLTKKLGQGGMGVVYLGERNDGQLKQRVAIKFIFPSIAALAGENFLQKEAQHLANLDHPNIAHIYTVGTSDTNLPYMVMEYVEGVAIDEYCKNKSLALKSCLILFQKVCDAVHFAHQNMVIHADIKPSNILVNELGEPKLMDFGIARTINQVINSETENSQLRKEYLQAVSHDYASPEQVNSNKTTVISDIYSLGKVFVFCLKYLAVNFEILAILKKMTNQKVIERFQSVTEIKIDFYNYISKFPLNSVRGTKFYSIKKFLQRHPISTGSISVLIAAITVSLITISVQYSQLLKEQIVSETTLNYLTDIFEYSAPENNQNHKISVKELLDKGREKISIKENPTITKRVELAIASAYYGIGEYDTAFDIIEKIMPSTGAKVKSNNYNAKAFYYLGEVYTRRGNFTQAIAAYEQAEKELIIPPRVMIKLKLAQSNALSQLNKLTESNELTLEAIELATQLNDTESIVNAYTQQAGLAFKNDKFEETIEICKKLVGLLDKDDIELYSTYLTMFNAQLRIYQFDDAEKNINKALSISRKVYGENHDKVAFAYYQLGMLHNYTESYEQSIKYFDIAIKIYRDVFPQGSPLLADVFYDKAFVLNVIAEYTKAIDLLEKALQMRKTFFGEVHPSIARVYSLMANTYLLIDDIELNKKYNLIALDIREKTLPEGNSVLLSSYSNIANVYNRNKEYIKAEKYINKAVVFAKKSPSLRGDLAFIYVIKGKILHSNLKLDESITTLKEAISIAIEVHGEQISNLSHFYYFLSISYRDNGQLVLALKSQEKAVSHAIQYLGNDHPLTNKFRTLLAELYIESGMLEKANILASMAYNFLQDKFGKEHRDTKQAKLVLDSLN
jgi:serine/threonine protein kinase